MAHAADLPASLIVIVDTEEEFDWSKPLSRGNVSVEEAERFVDEADLGGYDLSGFKPARFEFERKAARVNMRVPAALLDAVKSPARNVLCIFNELEGCPRQETSRRRCWSIVEGR